MVSEPTSIAAYRRKDYLVEKRKEIAGSRFEEARKLRTLKKGRQSQQRNYRPRKAKHFAQATKIAAV